MSGTGSALAKLEKEFLIHDLDESGDPAYYGFLNRSGQWYIIEATSETTFRYASQESVGSSNRAYTDAWTNRASLSYDYLSNINI
jgi:hypothetical protein